MKRMFVLLALLLIPANASAQAIVVVRHAERADAGMAAGASTDPDLSEAGRARAAALASMLKDARITRIYVTEFKRTRQTAEPLAALLKTEPIVIPAKDTPRLADALKAETGNVLVVGHSNTLPEIVKALGVQESIQVGEGEYDNLLVTTPGASPSLLRLRYR